MDEERLLILAARIHPNADDAAEMESVVRCCGLDWARVMRYSGDLGVQCLLYKHLREDRFAGHIPEEVLLHLKEHYYTQSMRSLRIYAQINSIVSAIGSSCIPIVLLKGAFLARWLYDDIALRPMGDIDILCRKCDERLLQSTLIELGYHQEKSIFHSPFHEAVQSVGRHHSLPFHKANAHTVEVHAQLFPDACRYALEMDRVWKTVADTKFDGLDIKCLALDYQFLYLCLHLYRHLASGSIALYWFCDIHELILHYRDQIDWNQLEATAHSLDVADQVETVFALLRAHWNTPLPERVLDGAGSFTPGFCLAAIIDNHLYEKREKIRLLSDYAQEIKSIFQVKGWTNRLHYLCRLIFPTRAHLMYRYKFTNPVAAGLCYLLLPFIRVKNLTAGLFYGALFQLKKKGRCTLNQPSQSDPK